ncbi:MAG TPA: hypothetical protein VGM95_01585 [Lactobacillaceae bacterium]|jgi:hypothetical protein
MKSYFTGTELQEIQHNYRRLIKRNRPFSYRFGTLVIRLYAIYLILFNRNLYLILNWHWIIWLFSLAYFIVPVAFWRRWSWDPFYATFHKSSLISREFEMTAINFSQCEPYAMVYSQGYLVVQFREKKSWLVLRKSDNITEFDEIFRDASRRSQYKVVDNTESENMFR